jgi:hypothetical protein
VVKGLFPHIVPGADFSPETVPNGLSLYFTHEPNFAEIKYHKKTNLGVKGHKHRAFQSCYRRDRVGVGYCTRKIQAAPIVPVTDSDTSI